MVKKKHIKVATWYNRIHSSFYTWKIPQNVLTKFPTKDKIPTKISLKSFPHTHKNFPQKTKSPQKIPTSHSHTPTNDSHKEIYLGKQPPQMTMTSRTHTPTKICSLMFKGCLAQVFTLLYMFSGNIEHSHIIEVPHYFSQATPINTFCLKNMDL